MHSLDLLQSDPTQVFSFPFEYTSTKPIRELESNGCLPLNFFNVPKTSIVLHWAQMFRAWTTTIKAQAKLIYKKQYNSKMLKKWVGTSIYGTAKPIIHVFCSISIFLGNNLKM